MSSSRNPSLHISPMLRMLLVASGICVGMVLARFAYVGTLRFRFCGLLLNLLLAWIPMLLAILARRTSERGSRVLFWASFVTWLLFFPNTFYITTDLIHTNKFGLDNVYWWYDHLMTVGFAVAGIFLGSISLYLLHTLVQQRNARGVGWLFVGATLALGSFGIYLGRFLRFNSWDVFLRPNALADGITGLADSQSTAEIVTFCAAFFVFSLAAYVFVVSAAQLHKEPVSAQKINTTESPDETLPPTLGI